MSNTPEDRAKKASEDCVGRKATPEELAAMNYQQPTEPKGKGVRMGVENPIHEILQLREEIEAFIEAGARNKEILDTTQISLTGLLDVIRMLIDERHELLEEPPIAPEAQATLQPPNQMTIGDWTFRVTRFQDPAAALNYARRSSQPATCILGDDETVWVVHPEVAEKLIKMGYEEAQ